MPLVVRPRSIKRLLFLGIALSIFTSIVLFSLTRYGINTKDGTTILDCNLKNVEEVLEHREEYWEYIMWRCFFNIFFNDPTMGFNIWICDIVFRSHYKSWSNSPFDYVKVNQMMEERSENQHYLRDLDYHLGLTEQVGKEQKFPVKVQLPFDIMKKDVHLRHLSWLSWSTTTGYL